MRIIGITGGVGAGKSTVLAFLEKEYGAAVIQADQVGHLVMEPGEECYEDVIGIFGKEIIKEDNNMAMLIKNEDGDFYLIPRMEADRDSSKQEQ